MPVVPKMLASVMRLVEQQASRKTSAVVFTWSGLGLGLGLGLELGLGLDA